MRELEFLPDWYPRLRARRRLVALQGWLSIIVVVVLGMWLLQAQRNTTGYRRETDALAEEASRSQERVEQLDHLLVIQKQLRAQEQVMEKLGLHVETTRLFNAIDEAMSEGMSLLELQVEVNDTPRPQPALVLATAANQKPEQRFDRRLKVRIQGVASTDVDVANFFEKLSGNVLFDNVTMNYARPRTTDGHVMREFEVSFSIDLNTKEG